MSQQNKLIDKHTLDIIAPVRLGENELGELATLLNAGYKVIEPEYVKAFRDLDIKE